MLNVILSREMTKCSEQQNPQGMLCLYCEMQKRGIAIDDSETSRLKRCIHILMRSGYVFDVPKSDDVFTRLWSECWLEERESSPSNLEDYLDEMKHSERNRMIELAVLLRFVMISLSSDL